MIHIESKEDCVGCNACTQKCPVGCISMNEDSEGFLYPSVNTELCIQCGLCDRVCPVINRNEPRLPLKSFAAKSVNNNLKKESSSGGLFTLLGEEIIKDGGVVFGAAFDEEWNVIHAYTESADGLSLFRGSKYVQSSVGNSYIQAKKFLKDGKQVLFSGTPCQIAGLKKFLRKDYDNLLCVEVICHGVPSPLVWRKYLRSIVSNKQGHKDVLNNITNISFRDKTISWKKYSLLISSSSKIILSQKHYHNDYLLAFLRNFILRYSCFKCPARKGRSGADIMLGDFWSVSRLYPDFYDDNGVSLCLIYSAKGASFINKLKIDSIEIKYEEALNNINIERDVNVPEERTTFFTDFNKSGVKVLQEYVKAGNKHPVRVLFENVSDKIKKYINL